MEQLKPDERNKQGEHVSYRYISKFICCSLQFIFCRLFLFVPLIYVFFG